LWQGSARSNFNPQVPDLVRGTRRIQGIQAVSSALKGIVLRPFLVASGAKFCLTHPRYRSFVRLIISPFCQFVPFVSAMQHIKLFAAHTD
jgi:hypothetical protein